MCGAGDGRRIPRKAVTALSTGGAQRRIVRSTPGRDAAARVAIAPSGTAARLLEIILEERKLTAAAVRHGRSGITGARPPGEVGVHALRGGDVVGDHTVIFAGLGERLELTHKASDRAIFARGALRAAQWVVSQPPGVYDMQDVLGLK